MPVQIEARSAHSGANGRSNGPMHHHKDGTTSPSGGDTDPRQRSPSQQPKNARRHEQMYILTLLTDPELHSAMNSLRKQYFPVRLNKLEAHITLFHALPESQLESKIMPAIKDLVSKTKPFQISATTPFKLKRGIAIGFPKDHGGDSARAVHRNLKRQWDDFLSAQDLSFQAHYTVMNKVDDSIEVDKAFHSLKSFWKAHYGSAEGLSLWKYHPSGWELVEHLRFHG